MKHHTSDIAGRVRWGAIGVAAAATLAFGSVAAANDEHVDRARTPAPAGDVPTDPYHACLRAGSMVPDRIEARAEECRVRTNPLYTDPAYVNCMRTAATTPDALEHWVDWCLSVARR